MAETKENVKETEVSQEGDTQVVRERVSSDSDQDKRSMVENAVWLILGVLEVLLVFRLGLKLLGANPSSGFANFLYTSTNGLTAPFRGIFSTPTAQGDITTSIFETGTLVAVIVYALVAWGIVKIVNLNQK
jgi:hypothetical protein